MLTSIIKGISLLIMYITLAQQVKNLPAMQKTRVWSLGWENPLEEEMATHSSILAWKILWTEEPGRLQSMGSQRVEHSWVTKHIAHILLLRRLYWGIQNFLNTSISLLCVLYLSWAVCPNTFTKYSPKHTLTLQITIDPQVFSCVTKYSLTVWEDTNDLLPF